MKSSNRSVGDAGELIAIQYLEKKGYVFILRNQRTPYGEIDLIMTKDNILVFVEVKTRISVSMGFPEESINLRKLTHFRKSVVHYMLENQVPNAGIRLDAVSIIMRPDGNPTEITHFENIQT